MFGRRRERRRRRRLTIWLAVIAGALWIWAWGLLGFVEEIPRPGLVNPSTRTDAIVVLTGGTLRLETGFDLMSRKLAEKLLVSGVDKSVPIEDILTITGLTAESMECCVTLGYQAQDTISNASESAAWIRANKIKSIRLVTSSYHMPRSLVEFRALMPELEIVPHPVFPKHVMIDEWWRRPGTAGLIIAEYNKYLLASLRSWAGIGQES